MAEPLSLSLQAFPPPDKEKESLKYLIQRVNAQRGAFRNVTEQSLEEEIRNYENGLEDDEHGEVAETTMKDTDTEREEVAKVREDILKETAYVLLFRIFIDASELNCVT